MNFAAQNISGRFQERMWFEKLISNKVSIAPLVIFRIIFGIMMALGGIRFWWNGWIEDFYLQPTFHFTYFGFDWVQVPSAPWLYALFGIMIGSAFFMAFGLLYRLASLLFFLSFTYIELLDKTTYLNHYYFVSLVAFLMIWLPANRRFALDNKLFNNYSDQVSAWSINILKFQLGIVYCYAGLAKINSDWLFDALPLRIWLPAVNHIPLLGNLLDQLWIAYFFSWFGAVYDLTIPFFLIAKRTRTWAYLFVIGFHVCTAILFPIGMFPYIMILSTMIYFSEHFHEKLLTILEKIFRYKRPYRLISKNYRYELITGFLIVYCSIQLLFPWRYLCYPSHLFWHEEGYRFSWRVMLMEKLGNVTFYVSEMNSEKKIMIDNRDWLTPFQEKEMSSQPDMILQFAHHLAKSYEEKGLESPKVTADAFVTLNGRKSERFIDPNINLAAQKEGWAHKRWILDYPYSK